MDLIVEKITPAHRHMGVLSQEKRFQSRLLDSRRQLGDPDTAVSQPGHYAQLHGAHQPSLLATPGMIQQADRIPAVRTAARQPQTALRPIRAPCAHKGSSRPVCAPEPHNYLNDRLPPESHYFAANRADGRIVP